MAPFAVENEFRKSANYEDLIQLRLGENISSDVQILDLQNNLLGDEGTIALISGLIMSNPTLLCVDLENNEIGDDGATFIAQWLRTNPCLGKIILDSKRTSYITKENNIGKDGMTAIADALKTNTHIFVNIGGNEIKEDGATAIGQMLKKNSSISCIHLLLNKIGKYGGEAVFESLAHNSTIYQLLVDRHYVPSEFDGMTLHQIRGFTTALEHG